MSMEQSKQIISDDKPIDLNEKFVLFILIVLVFCFLFIDKTKKPVEPIDLSKVEEAVLLEHKNLEYGGEVVIYNTNSGKFHEADCPWAKKCKHCIKILKSDAIKRGGKPCRACGV